MRNTDIEANGEDLLTGAFITAIVYVSGILIPMIISICYVVKCRTHCCLKVTVYLQLAIEFCLALVIMILAFESSRMYRTYSEQVIRLDEAVQGCMDQYSDIPDYVVKDLLVLLAPWLPRVVPVESRRLPGARTRNAKTTIPCV